MNNNNEKIIYLTGLSSVKNLRFFSRVDKYLTMSFDSLEASVI